MVEKKIIPPKHIREGEWESYKNEPWLKQDKKDVTVMFSFVERRKSLFLRAYFKRKGIKCIDMGDHVKEDVHYGKLYGTRMQCNPIYFTSGALVRNLIKVEEETGLSKEEIAQKYVFLSGGGQCGPCRYGMYSQEYFKVLNEAGYKDFRIIVFGSDLGRTEDSSNHTLKFELLFRIEMALSFILADFFHALECSMVAYAENPEEVVPLLEECEQMLLKAFEKRSYFLAIPRALKKANKILSKVAMKQDVEKPLIYVTGEFFANLAHNDGNYNLRRFITNEGCEVIPGNFTQRTLYDNWRRTVEAKRGIKYAVTAKESKFHKKMLKKQKVSSWVILKFYHSYRKALNPEQFRARVGVMNLGKLAEVARDYYHPEIFGGEGNLEVAEAIHLAEEDKIDGFISSKPFGCMPSSGVSDGVQAKIMHMYPNLNFLSIETSGDNDVSILSRVSMLLLKAKQRKNGIVEGLRIDPAFDEADNKKFAENLVREQL